MNTGTMETNGADVLLVEDSRTETELMPASLGDLSGQGQSSLVLVADDNDAVRSTLQRLLLADGLRVVTATDGRAALDRFRDRKPDLVLLDVLMPQMDGLEVCRQLKSDPETRLTPVVLLTGLGSTRDRVRGIEAGADDFLSKPFEQVELLARVRSLLRLKHYTDELEQAEDVVFALARAIEARDAGTEDHCERLADYAVRLGERLGLAEEDIAALRRAGIVHDIGKVAIPDAILLKPGRLTPAERVVMQEHPVVGERICSGLKSFRRVLPIIRHHHEKLDGSGYPDGLEGEEIPLTARVLQVVDVYDALTTQRPYKPALSSAEALETMRAEVAKGWWDPRVFAEFARSLPQNLNPWPREHRRRWTRLTLCGATEATMPWGGNGE